MNPVVFIRQKSKFIQKTQGQSKVRRLSELQWQYVIKTACLIDTTICDWAEPSCLYRIDVRQVAVESFVIESIANQKFIFHIKTREISLG